MQEEDREGPKKSRLVHVDEWMRERLDPPRESVERVIRRALQAPSSRSDQSRIGPWLLAAVVTVIVLTIAVPLVVLERRGAHQDGVLVPRITNESGRVELIWPNSGRRRLSVKESSRSIGPPVVFNEAGVIGAIIPGEEPCFLLRGGKS
jgi:hypothetical protein